MKKLLALCLCLCLSLVLTALSFAQDKPNIVLVMADDQGWGDMAYNGHPLLKTPNFDAAAADGLRFDRFYAAAPVCSPTRASVLTGRHPNRIGVFKWGHTLRPQEITIAEALRTAGYATSHFGKWHLGSLRKGSPVSPGASGFDEWLSAPNFYDNDPVLSHNGVAVAIEGESSVVAADAAIAWMKTQVEAKKPFLSVVWFGSPHSPHRAAPEDFELYKDQPAANAHFLGEVTGMDRAFGKIRDSLTDLGIRDNTILWYTSDNGALPKVGATGGFRGNKGQVYEGGLLVPTILEWPARIPKHRVSAARCNTTDIYPTLLEIVGAKVEKQPVLDGRSLVSIIDDKEPAGRGMGFWDFPIGGKGMKADDMMKEILEAQAKGEELPVEADSLNAAEIDPLPKGAEQLLGHAAWMEGDWKLHRITGKTPDEVKFELYNLADDPKETKDLLAGEAGRVAPLTASLEAWMKSVISSLKGEDYR